MLTIRLPYRSAWSLPRLCCACGSPALGACSYRADDTGTEAVMPTSSMDARHGAVDLEFPLCDTCANAPLSENRWTYAATVAGGLMGWLIFSSVVGRIAPSTAEQWFDLFVAILLTGLGTGTIVHMMWRTVTGPDTRQRADIAVEPVRIASEHDVVAFEFENDEYGREFERLNLVT